MLHLGDKVKLRRTEDGGRREVIRVNGITLTAYGWLQLFKTHLRMGNFLSGVFWELPHLVVAEMGTELSLQFLLRLKLFCQRPRNACVAPLLSPFINIYLINNPVRFPQSKGRTASVCMSLRPFSNAQSSRSHCLLLLLRRI